MSLPNVNNGNEILLANISATSTTAYTYRTNPFSSSTNTGIQLFPVYYQNSNLACIVAIYVVNQSNEAVSVTPISNITNEQSVPDFTYGSAAQIAAGGADMLYVYMKGVNPQPAEFISLSFKYSTVPTSTTNYVAAWARFY